MEGTLLVGPAITHPFGLVVRAAGAELTDVESLQAALDAPGTETLELAIVRGADELTITVVLDAPAATTAPGG